MSIVFALRRQMKKTEQKNKAAFRLAYFRNEEYSLRDDSLALRLTSELVDLRAGNTNL